MGKEIFIFKNSLKLHPIVYTILVGTIFVTIAKSMSVPFLAIYLSQKTELSLSLIGAIIGLGPLASTIGGFIGGTLSDLLGRRRVMIFSLFALSLVFVGYNYTTHPILLALLSITNGLCGSFFDPVSKALMADVTDKDRRARIFSFNYLAINVGHAVGPLLGAYAGLSGSIKPFLATALVYFIYPIVLQILLNRFGIKKIEEKLSEESTFKGAFKILVKDRALRWFVSGAIFSVTVHGQISVTLSQHLERSIPDAIWLFSVLLSVNSLVIILGQIPLNQWLEKKEPFLKIVWGSILLTFGTVGFAFSSNWSLYIVSMIVFTIGEILIVPTEYVLIDQITPEDMRGTYYGVITFSNLGNFLGPWVGSTVLGSFGGTAMFLMFSLIALVGIIFYWRGQVFYRIRLQEEKRVKVI